MGACSSQQQKNPQKNFMMGGRTNRANVGFSMSVKSKRQNTNLNNQNYQNQNQFYSNEYEQTPYQQTEQQPRNGNKKNFKKVKLRFQNKKSIGQIHLSNHNSNIQNLSSQLNNIHISNQAFENQAQQNQNQNYRHDQQNIINEPKQQQMNHSKMENQQQVNQDQYLCKICMNNQSNMIGIICGHLSTCEECCNYLKGACPICRTEQAFKKVYIS